MDIVDPEEHEARAWLQFLPDHHGLESELVAANRSLDQHFRRLQSFPLVPEKIGSSRTRFKTASSSSAVL